MSQYAELLSSIPMSQLAQQVGADEAEVEQAVKQVLPALVGGLSANAQQPAGAAALTGALGDHTDRDPLTDPSTIDTDDGAKIVHHIFGNQSEDVVNQLGGLGGGAGSGLIKKLLPILAPIVLSWLARKLSGGGGLGGVIGDALGGDAPQQTPKDTPATGQGGVGDLLGDLLGGALGKSASGGQSGGFGLDDLLGGLLGGKR